MNQTEAKGARATDSTDSGSVGLPAFEKPPTEERFGAPVPLGTSRKGCERKSTRSSLTQQRLRGRSFFGVCALSILDKRGLLCTS